MKQGFKQLAKLSLSVVLAASLITGGAFAGSQKKYLEAYDDVQIEYNGANLTGADGPLIINNKTYLPLRMLMDTFGDKSVIWDNAMRKVKIFNKQSASETGYMNQIAQRNARIAELEKEVQALKAQIATSGTSSDKKISDLKKDLNDDYEDYDKKDIKISLSGDTSKIKLTVTLKKADWSDFSASEKENFMEKLCDDIWDEFSKATIDGTIKDGSKELDSFTVKAGKDVSLDDGDEDEDDDAADLSDLSSAIVKKFKTDWTDEKLVLSLKLSGTKTNLTYKVSLDMSKYDDEWDDLSASEKKGLMDDIYDEIKDEYSKATVKGYVYDTDKGKNVATYDGSKLTE